MLIRLRQINLAYGNQPLLDDAVIALGVGERAAVGAANRAFGAAPNPDFIELYCYPKGISVDGPGTYARMDPAHAELPAGIRLALLAEDPFEYIQTAGTEVLVEA